MADNKKHDDEALPDTVFKFAWKHTRKQQIWVLAIALLSMPTYFFALDIPKRIVNGPIQGGGFPTEEARQAFLQFAIDIPVWLGGPQTVELFSGFSLDRWGSLIALSFAFLALVVINGLFKFYINLYKGRLGERMLRRLRFDLIERVLRFPILYFKRVKPSEVASMVKDEVEPIGGFVGEAFVTPMFLGGQALTAMAFIMLQSFWLGLIAGGIVLVQALLIPRLRRRLVELGRQRQLTARQLAGKVGELVDGITAVHVNDTSNYERADVSARLGHIFAIRYELFQRKFFVKFLNNFLAQVTPFVFYLLGGYFALTGQLDIGQLVAVIAAYKDLPAPIKDLINWDQQRLDVQVKYTQVVEQFYSDGMIDKQLQEARLEPVTGLTDGFRLSGLSVVDDTGTRLLENVTTQFSLNQQIAVVGGLNSGGETLADVLARLLPESRGSIKLGSSELCDLPECVTGRRIGYVPSDVPLFFGSFGDNLIYSLKHAPFKEKDYDEQGKKRRQWELAEARNAGNSELDINADWTNYKAAGATGQQDLIFKIMDTLKLVDMNADVMNFGLKGIIDPVERPDLAEKILAARDELKTRLVKEPYSEMVELFDPDVYTTQATIGENLLFGTFLDGEFDGEQLHKEPYLHQVLKENDLLKDFYEVGREMASTAIELFADLDPGHPFFEQLSFMTAEEMSEYQVVLARTKGAKYDNLAGDDRQMLVRLAFGYVEPRHRMGLLSDELRTRLLIARKAFRRGLPDNLKSVIEFYDPLVYNCTSSVQDNILMGRIAYGIAEGEKTILGMLRDVLEEHELHDEIFTVGLEFNVGVAGKRLTSAQRQKLGLARALLKQPDFLIVNRALAALDRASQEKIIDSVVTHSRNSEGTRGIFWVLASPVMAKKFDRVLVMDQGRVVEDGTPDELLAKEGRFTRLIA
ncbi:Efflux ABC transporter, permease/ATP-binding protein [hydrothermal vent metagenome]|uniref:Efflux ABC transporter, permease/ATP-binding protein n=1 Tax=hydrothermal vent metagenome TaxID=652676 RepID=A0A3B0RW89_9ZZZZ